MLPCHHVPHVHGRHLSGLSHAAESSAGQVSACAWGHAELQTLNDDGNLKFTCSCVFVRFSVERSALSVVIYPLQHEDLPSVIRDIPLTLLDRITLFQSHVAQPPHLSQLWHHQKASVWLVLNSWVAQTVLFFFSAGNKILKWKTNCHLHSDVWSCYIHNCFRLLYDNTSIMIVYIYVTE